MLTLTALNFLIPLKMKIQRKLGLHNFWSQSLATQWWCSPRDLINPLFLSPALEPKNREAFELLERQQRNWLILWVTKLYERLNQAAPAQTDRLITSQFGSSYRVTIWDDQVIFDVVITVVLHKNIMNYKERHKASTNCNDWSDQKRSADSCTICSHKIRLKYILDDILRWITLRA